MKAKSTILAAAVAAVLSAGMSDEASASIYARSYLEIDNLALRISDDGGVTPGGASVKNFQFFLTNTAFLNGVGGAAQATCFGLPGAPAAGTNNCNPRPNTGLNTPGTILDAAAVMAVAAIRSGPTMTSRTSVRVRTSIPVPTRSSIQPN
jgi:hypothetical protein